MEGLEEEVFGSLDFVGCPKGVVLNGAEKNGSRKERSKSLSNSGLTNMNQTVLEFALLTALPISCNLFHGHKLFLDFFSLIFVGQKFTIIFPRCIYIYVFIFTYYIIILYAIFHIFNNTLLYIYTHDIYVPMVKSVDFFPMSILTSNFQALEPLKVGKPPVLPVPWHW